MLESEEEASGRPYSMSMYGRPVRKHTNRKETRVRDKPGGEETGCGEEDSRRTWKDGKWRRRRRNSREESKASCRPVSALIGSS